MRVIVRQLSIDQFENEGRRVGYETPESATAARKPLDRKMSINSVPKKPLTSSYGLAKHRDGRWEWAIAPGVSPSPRYQHAAVSFGCLRKYSFPLVLCSLFWKISYLATLCFLGFC